MTPRPKFRFRLFVAGDAGNSAQAVANLSAFCRTYLPEGHMIEVVDVLREPKRALAESIFLTPTLVALAPPPVRRIVGTLGQTQVLLRTLGLEGPAP